MDEAISAPVEAPAAPPPAAPDHASNRVDNSQSGGKLQERLPAQRLWCVHCGLGAFGKDPISRPGTDTGKRKQS